MRTLLQNKLILGVIALVIAGGAWYGLSPASESPTLTSTASGSTQAEAGIVPTLLMLRAVKLDGTIFSDPVFVQLRDFSIEIVAEPVGRTNPFAPLSKPSQPTPTR